MLDAHVRPLVDRCLNPAGRLLARVGITANQISVIGFGFGLAAALAVMLGSEPAAVVLIAANRICDGLDGAVARASGTSDLGAYLDITLDFLFYSAIPFAFAVADPEKALAASFLIFSFVGTGSSFLAFAIIAQKRGISTEIRGKKGFFYLGGLTEGSETIIFLVIVAYWPDLFVPLAFVFGSLCWVTTATRVWHAFERFSDREQE